MTKIRLSQYDRLQALVRNAQYQEDYNRYSRGKVSYEECQKLIEKWEVPYLFDPQEVKKWWWFKEAYQDAAFFPSPVKVIPHEKEKTLRKVGKKWVAIPDEEIVMSKVSKKTMKKRLSQLNKKLPLEEIMPVHRIDFTPHLEKGHYLTLKIDLWAKKEEILKEFEEKLDFYRSDAKPPKGRIRETAYNPWLVYDLRKQGKKYEDIVKLIDPTGQKDLLLARIDAAHKAYRKAYRMLKAVESGQ